MPIPYTLNAKRYTLNASFTLIELLVVITIIGVMASMSVVALNSARIKARDARRMADISLVRTALGIYYDDYSVFPSAFCDQGEPTTNGWNKDLRNALIPSVGRPYIDRLPEDPKNTGDFVYKYCSPSSDSYKISYKLEGENKVYTILGY